MGIFFERKPLMSLVGVYLRLNVATSRKKKKKEFSCAKKEKKRMLVND
jgi:hypothetical protein